MVECWEVGAKLQRGGMRGGRRVCYEVVAMEVWRRDEEERARVVLCGTVTYKLRWDAFDLWRVPIPLMFVPV